MMTKEEALMKFLDCTGDEISDEGDNMFSFHSEEYLVLTHEEAFVMTKESIRQSLWAFNTSFLLDYMPTLEPILEYGSIEISNAIQKMQENLCESANEIIFGLVNNRFNDLVEDAIDADGIGHFLAGYDGEENEEGEYFIYRIN